MRRTLATLTAVLVLVLGAGAQATGEGGPDNIVTATTTGTNATDEESALQVASYGGDDLRSSNFAHAQSHDCTDCRTVAVAVQAVLATGHPSKVEPVNVALATNETCLRCATYAFAWQWVVTTDGPVHLSEHARKQVRRLRREISAAAHSDLAFPDLDARLTALADELRADIKDDLSHAGEHWKGRVETDESEAPQR